MIETRQNGDIREIAATQGWLRLKGSRDFTTVRRCVMLPSQTPDDFEEITQLPLYSEADYADRVERLIRQRYTLSQELAVQRQRYAKPAEFEAYDAYAERCKALARAQLAAEAREATATDEPILPDTPQP